MSAAQLLENASAIQESRFRYAGYDPVCFREFQDQLSAAKDGVSAGNWEPYQNLIAYMRSPNMRGIFLDIIGRE